MMEALFLKAAEENKQPDTLCVRQQSRRQESGASCTFPSAFLLLPKGWWAQPGFLPGATPVPAQPTAALLVTCFTDGLLFPASCARFVCSSQEKEQVWLKPSHASEMTWVG